MKIKLSSPDAIIDAIKNAISGMNSGLEGELDAQMAKVSKQAYEKAKEFAAQRLFKTKQQYLDNLSMYKVGQNVYAIRLEADAVHLDTGYPRYDLKPGLLGLNSGGTKKGVKISKKGYKYRVIPFTPEGAPAKASHPQHNSIMQHDRTPDSAMGDPGRGPGSSNPSQATKQGDFSSQFNALKKSGNKVAAGLPTNFRGRAWSVEAHPTDSKMANIRTSNGNVKSVNMGRDVHPNLIGMSNMRAPADTGGSKVRSAYVTFRVVSENPSQAGKWWNPGYVGAHIMPDVQRWTEDTFSNMADAIFRKAI